MISFEKLVKFFNDYPWAVIMSLEAFAIIELFRRLMRSGREHMDDLRTILPLADKLADMLKAAAASRKRLTHQNRSEE